MQISLISLFNGIRVQFDRKEDILVLSLSDMPLKPRSSISVMTETKRCMPFNIENSSLSPPSR
jgi:hypothetical protein